MDEGITDDLGTSSKRRFSLVDEKENYDVCDPIGKKIKKTTDELFLSEHVVEAASQEWPQMTQ